MAAYWVKIDRGGKTPGAYCVEASSIIEIPAIVAQAFQDAAIQRIQMLPYPAMPRIGVQSGVPAFCYSPNECAGRASCPKRYACSE